MITTVGANSRHNIEEIYKNGNLYRVIRIGGTQGASCLYGAQIERLLKRTGEEANTNETYPLTENVKKARAFVRALADMAVSPVHLIEVADELYDKFFL